MRNLVAGVLFAVALGGCATPPSNREDPAKLKATHGYVVAVVPIAWNAATSTVVLKARGGDTRVALDPTGGALRLNSAWVPAGEYDIEEMQAKGNASSLPPILVLPGRATDIGGLRLFDVGAYETVLVPLSHPELSKTVSGAIAAQQSHLSGETIRWSPKTLPPPQEIRGASPNLGIIVALLAEYERSVNKPSALKQLREARSVDDFPKIARQLAALTIDAAAQDEAGNAYFPADFGQLRVRSRTGNWLSIDTGTTVPVTAVQATGKRLTAGTRDGQIRMAESPTSEWILLSRLDDDEAVLDIDYVQGRWFVLTMQAPYIHANPQSVRLKGFRIYSALRSDLSDLTRVRSFDSEGLAIFSLIRARGEPFGSYFYVNAGGSLGRFSLSSLQWEELKIGHEVSHFRISPQSGVVTAFLAGGAFSKLSISVDAGNTFVREETPPYAVSDIYFSTPSAAAASRWSAGAFSADLQTLRFDPIKKTWPVIATFDSSSCVRIIRTPSWEPSFCLSRSGSILRIDGAKLVMEFAAD